jgi:hypothetical protein
MPLISKIVYQAVNWRARHGLRDDSESVDKSNRTRKRRTGVRGETFAYWYLSRLGYVFVARNYTPRGRAGGEVDLTG